MLLAAFTLSQILSYPFPSAPVRDAGGNAIAYTLDTQGVRTVWFARGPQFAPKMLWSSGADDGQELSDLVISNDDRYIVYVRGGDHDENWPVPLQPNPASFTAEQQEQVWSASTDGAPPKLIGDGDAPAISPDGTRVVFVDGAGAVEVAPVDGSASAKRLFFDRGKDSELHWSPDGSALAFVSSRDGDHSFIGIYRNGATSLQFLAPTTSQDFMPRWSPDGSSVAFIRTPGAGGAPQNPLDWNPQPWQIWVARPGTAYAQPLWASGTTSRDSLPQSGLGPFLEWIGRNRLVFNSEQDNWPRLYALQPYASSVVEFAGNVGKLARPLTPPNVMVENVSISPNLDSLVYAANGGRNPGDDDRRHLYRIRMLEDMVIALSSGESSEFEPVALADGSVAYDRATAQQPPLVTLLVNSTRRAIDANALPADFPSPQLVTPQEVSFHAADGTKVYGQLFLPRGGAKHPGIIFVHGGPVRQMLLTWHYMDYYSNAYAVNQYLASRGFVVLSVNYRTGIGYGHDFNFPAKWGPTGASEYQDVVAGARFLQRQPNVDAKRIGIWGGSYGGYLTALALARNSDIFEAGVDFHGVHDWSLDIDNPVWAGTQLKRYQQYDEHAMMKLAWESSPDSAIATWKSPVLLIQGDDDRNVEFHQMVDLVERLRAAHVPFEQIVIPNEIHGFLRYASWAMADEATVDYFEKQLSSSS